jgi:hypothetical protein
MVRDSREFNLAAIFPKPGSGKVLQFEVEQPGAKGSARETACGPLSVLAASGALLDRLSCGARICTPRFEVTLPAVG